MLFTIISIYSLVSLGSEPKDYLARGAFGSVSNLRFLHLHQAHWRCLQASDTSLFPHPLHKFTASESGSRLPQSRENCSQRVQEPRLSFHPGCSRAGRPPPPGGRHVGYTLSLSGSQYHTGNAGREISFLSPRPSSLWFSLAS